MNLEEDYMDVFQNIETVIVQVYHKYPELADFDVEMAVGNLMDRYKSEQRGRAPRPMPLNELSQDVYAAAEAMCEWRLGRGESGLPVAPEPLPLEIMVAILKRLLKSIDMWTKRGGRRGYLTFIQPFIA
jgi:hypothetical protein